MQPSAVTRLSTGMLARSAEVRFHVAKNRYLTILRNDTLRGYLKNLPFILTRDLATIALLLTTSPGVLQRLWRARALFREVVERRKRDADPAAREGGSADQLKGE